MEEDLMYTNKFINDSELTDLPDKVVESFRRYTLEKQEREARVRIARELSEQVNFNYSQDDLMNTNAIVSQNTINNVYNNVNNTNNVSNVNYLTNTATTLMMQNLPQEMLPMNFLGDEEEDFRNSGRKRGGVENYSSSGAGNAYDNVKTQENIRSRQKVSLVNIDSRTRNTSLYPNAYDFQINLDRVYRFIKKIRVASVEVTNDALVVDRPNNIIEYSVENDDRLFIKKIITPGNPDIFCIVDEINRPDETHMIVDNLSPTFDDDSIYRAQAYILQARYDDCTGRLDLFSQNLYETPEITFKNTFIAYNGTAQSNYRGLLGVFGDFNINSSPREFDYIRIEGLETEVFGFKPNDINGIHEVKAVEIIIAGTTGAGGDAELRFSVGGPTLSANLTATTHYSVLSFLNDIQDKMNIAAGYTNNEIYIVNRPKVGVAFINTDGALTVKFSDAAFSSGLKTRLGQDSAFSTDVPLANLWGGQYRAEFVAPFIKVDGFYIRAPTVPQMVATPATTIVIAATNVNIARMVPFELKFDEQRTSIGKKLGYLPEDTADLIKEYKPLEINSVTTQAIEGTGTYNPLFLTQYSHGFTTGDVVSIRANIQQFSPPVLEDERYVISVVSNYTFTIPIVIGGLAVGTAFSGQVEKIESGQLETNVKSIESITTGSITIITITGHTFDTGDTIKITGVKTSPDIISGPTKGIFNILIAIDDNIFINFETTSVIGNVTGGIVAANRIKVNHTKHFLFGSGASAANAFITMYGVSETVGGLNPGVFNGKSFFPINIDLNSYFIEVNSFPTSQTPTGGSGGTEIRINTNHNLNIINYGHRSKQSNLKIDQRTVHKYPDLSGERYIYIVSPSLRLGVINDTDTKILNNILAKVLLNVPKNSISYEFIITDKTFIEQVINELSVIRLQLKKQDGTTFNTLTDYSVTLEITEGVQHVKASAFNSQSGQIDTNVTF